MEQTKTFILLAVMTALFVAVGGAIGGQGGAVLAFAIAGVMNIISYWNSDKIVLKMYRARPVEPNEHPRILEMLERLARNAGMPIPKAYIIDNPQPNAFATGRNPENAAVAMTTGIMKILTEDELEGVMAHELAHIKNRDTLTMTVTATIAGAIGMIANFAQIFAFSGRGNGENNDNRNPAIIIVTAILAPLAAGLVQMAISRTREYQADRVGAEICGKPLELASALAKISGMSMEVANETAEENPATAHMFIINPISGSGFRSLFSTHPSTESRILELKAIANEIGNGNYASDISKKVRRRHGSF